MNEAPERMWNWSITSLRPPQWHLHRLWNWLPKKMIPTHPNCNSSLLCFGQKIKIPIPHIALTHASLTSSFITNQSTLPSHPWMQQIYNSYLGCAILTWSFTNAFPPISFHPHHGFTRFHTAICVTKMIACPMSNANDKKETHRQWNVMQIESTLHSSDTDLASFNWTFKLLLCPQPRKKNLRPKNRTRQWHWRWMKTITANFALTHEGRAHKVIT